MNVNARLVRNVKTDHVATSERKLGLETGRATTTSTYIVESVKDGALAANIAKMRLKGQSCIRSRISSRLRISLVGSLSRSKRLELGLESGRKRSTRPARLPSFLGSPVTSHELFLVIAVHQGWRMHHQRVQCNALVTCSSQFKAFTKNTLSNPSSDHLPISLYPSLLYKATFSTILTLV